MAEILGVAASAISVVAFAGQLAEGFTSLYTFFNNFKDAPQDIRALSQELQILALMLTNVKHSSHQSDVGLSEALKVCEEVAIKLSGAIKELQPAQSGSKSRMWVKQFRATLKRSELEKYLGALERAKSTLLQCCMTSMRVDQARERGITKAIEKSLGDVARDQASSSTATHAMTNIVRQIDLKTSSLDATTANIVQMTSQTFALTERLTDDSLHMQEASARIEKAIQDLIESNLSSQPQLLQLFDRNINRTIRKSVRRHLKEALESEVDHTIPDEIKSNSLDLHHRSSGETPPYSAQNPCATLDDTHALQSEWIRTSTDTKMTCLMSNSVFGTVTITNTIMLYSRRSDREREVHQQRGNCITIRYFPRSWISSKGVVATYSQWAPHKAYMHSTPLFGLRTINIVPEGADIFKACWNLDLDEPLELENASDDALEDADNKLIALVDMLTVNKDEIDLVSEHAKFHNHQTFNIWCTALEKATRANCKEDEGQIASTGLKDQGTQSVHGSIQDGERSNEPELEREEGPMLDSARETYREDERDASKHGPGCECEGCWR
ncbi:hypothetical protein F4808DRAFT_472920 [Astrocystis sublimbata]|nr:hypothetical protein F4808DRAFT_472920 [Astrocystis sublimbata]